MKGGCWWGVVLQKAVEFLTRVSPVSVSAIHFLRSNQYPTKYGSFRGISSSWLSMKGQFCPHLWSSSATWPWYSSTCVADGGNMRVTQMKGTTAWVSLEWQPPAATDQIALLLSISGHGGPVATWFLLLPADFRQLRWLGGEQGTYLPEKQCRKEDRRGWNQAFLGLHLS